MSQLTDYSNNDVVGDIIKSLHERVAKAIANGVRRWNIILDPGIGKVIPIFEISSKLQNRVC
jgi:dihydroneopterin aldolase/2-amino-4-hydroxy-6-hydroxymethyldihydropteridine diphosphokinase/dihydropteroate synthase